MGETYDWTIHEIGLFELCGVLIAFRFMVVAV